MFTRLFIFTRVLTVAGCFVGALLLLACVPLIRGPQSARLAPSVRTAPISSTVPTEAQVTMDNFTFAPAIITVTVGTTVTWRNQDDTPHTVTEANQRFGSQGLDTGEQFTYRFTASGVYTYFCTIHPMMIGHVIVK